MNRRQPERPRDANGRDADGRKLRGRRLLFLEIIELPTGRRNPDGTLVLDPAGRPEVRRVQRGQAIVEALGVGCTYKAACEMVNIDDSTFYKYMAIGREEAQAEPPRETPHAEFFRQVTRACARSESAILADIRRICRDRGDARTLLELLGRRFPERWGRVERVELTGAEGEPLVPEHVADRAILEAAREVEERRKQRPSRKRQRGGDLPTGGGGSDPAAAAGGNGA